MKLLYVYPISIIQEIFPNFNPDVNSCSEDTELTNGWNKNMQCLCGYAFYYNDSLKSSNPKYRVYQAKNCRFYFDERITKIIEVDKNLKKDCYFVEPITITVKQSPFDAPRKIDAYRITKHRSELSIGGVKNIKKITEPRKTLKLKDMISNG